MRIKIKMPNALKPYFQHELSCYELACTKDDFSQAWVHLERAHVLGQAYPREHSAVHWKMLRFGIRIKSKKEVLGQIPRLLVGGVKSFVGVIPLGNTGGANIPPLKSLPIQPELKQIFKQAGIEVC